MGRFYVHNMLMIGPPESGKILLARTIVDLASSESVVPAHLAEAIQYRSRLLAMHYVIEILRAVE